MSLKIQLLGATEAHHLRKEFRRSLTITQRLGVFEPHSVTLKTVSKSKAFTAAKNIFEGFRPESLCVLRTACWGTSCNQRDQRCLMDIIGDFRLTFTRSKP